MAEFQEVMKQLKRMCDSYENNKCGSCKINDLLDGHIGCAIFTRDKADKAEKIIMDWAKEHPIKTNRDKFNEILEQVFGVKLNEENLIGCAGIACPGNKYECDECKYKGFWEKEYRERKKV